MTNQKPDAGKTIENMLLSPILQRPNTLEYAERLAGETAQEIEALIQSERRAAVEEFAARVEKSTWQFDAEGQKNAHWLVIQNMFPEEK